MSSAACPRAATSSRETRDDRVELAAAIEWIAPPRVIEVALLDELQAPRGGANRGGLPIRARDNAFAACAERPRVDLASSRWNESLERFVEEALLLASSAAIEERIDARLDGPLAEELGAERVDRPDVRGLELGERAIETRADFVGRRRARASRSPCGGGASSRPRPFR